MRVLSTCLVSHTCEYSVFKFKFKFKLMMWAAPLPQATQLYGTANEDVEEESEIDEAVCAVRPFGRRLSNTVGRRLAMMLRSTMMMRCDGAAGLTRSWQRARGASPRYGLRADLRWTMSSRAGRARRERRLSGMSEMAPDDAHDELMCSMDVVAEVHAQDAEREQQREGASVGCVCWVRHAERRWRGRRRLRGRTSARG